jgi:HD superfamily phosphohydrolase
MTGARYGNFDREWMLRTLSLAKVENTIEAMDDGSSSEKPPGVLSIVVDAKRGMSGLEQHILGRHYMYKHVYYHKTIRAAEGMLRMILKRAAILVKENRLEINNAGFRKLAKGKEMTADDYLSLHDFLILSWVDEWAHFAKDEILKDLSRRFISREIFGVIYPGNVTRKSYEDNREKVKNLLQKHTKNPDYYFIEDGPKDIAYKDLFDYREKEKSPQEIWYLDENGRPQPLTAFDGLLKQGKKALEFFEERWYLPRELKEKAMKLVQLKKGGQIT